jgi:Flp pilus assembly pilin Flp
MNMTNDKTDSADSDSNTMRALTERSPFRRVRLVLRRFSRDQRGVALLEYGMLAVLVAVFAFKTVSALGGNVDAALKNVSDKVAELKGK